MPKSTQVIVPIVLLILGTAIGYGISYITYQPYQAQALKLQSDLTTVQATLSTLQSNYANAQTVLATLNNTIQAIIMPNITILSYPSQVTVYEDFTVRWNVTGGIPGIVTHTEAHTLNATDPAQDIFASQIFTGHTPEVFESIITAPPTPGTFTFHFHAVVDGKEIFTKENNIAVTSRQYFDVILGHPKKALSIDKGDNSTITVTIVSAANFSSPVDLSIASLPTGVTATLNQTQATPPPDEQVNVSLSLTVAENAVAGNYVLHVTGTSGATTESDGLTLIIREPGVTVEILGYAFSPNTVSVVEGTTVTWINKDPVVHRVMGNGWDSGDIQTGQSWSYTFMSAGFFDYSDYWDPENTGSVIVI